ncbi:hypothetical protein [Roseateles sp.]|uniref:hypothetical protein n=1 Tax=Roseateles sp. TaxID=1971397 RepID=UPI002DF8BDDE|nr:hypothetical protein [Roseateles sp.]
MRIAVVVTFIAWVAIGFSRAAQAQIVELDRPDSQALSCLQKTGPAIRYPAQDEAIRAPGHLRLSLKFTAPDRAPEVTVLFRAASEAMLDQVRWFVRGYRLPCLPADGAAVLAVQEFEFKPRVTDPITWTAPRAVVEQEARAAQDSPKALTCLRTPKTPPEFAGTPWQGEIANVFVELTFTAPDSPPAVKVAYAGANASGTQIDAVTEYVQRYRLPCMAPGGKPYSVQQQFQFRPYGAGARVFKDAVPLRTFLASIKGIRGMQARFDLRTMGCPFQVAWTLGKPALDNRVGQIGTPDLNRTEFLVWLAGLQMDLKERSFEELLGQTVIIDVPCGTLNLGGDATAPST